MNDQAFRLRERMRAAVRERSRVVSFGVLGARGGVGTTTVTAALALGAARLGFRTLLADRPGCRDLDSLFRHDVTPLEILDGTTEAFGADPQIDDPERFERAILDLGARRDGVADPADRLEPALHRLIVVTTAHPWSMASCVEMVAARVAAGLDDRLRIVFNRVDPKKFRPVRQRFEEACRARCGVVPEIAATLRAIPALESALMPVGLPNFPGAWRERFMSPVRRVRRPRAAGHDGPTNEFESLMPLLFVPKTARPPGDATPAATDIGENLRLEHENENTNGNEHETEVKNGIPAIFRIAA